MAVGDYNVSPFTLPVEPSPIAYQTRNNDNLLRASFVAHQSDTIAHVQSGTAVPTGTAATGAVYFRTLAGSESVYIYNGSSWTLISGASGPGWTPELVDIVWGIPSKSGTSYTISATSQDISGISLSTDEIGVMIVVSDGAGDCEPSASATISTATSPVGSLLAGGGTATAVFKTNPSGQFSIKVTEPSAGVSRYLWVKAGGHFQRFVKARDGVLQLTY